MKRIRFNEPFVTGRELDYVRQVFDAGHFQGAGPFTRRCEVLLRERLKGSVDVLLTDSCTSALEISALLLREWDSAQEIVLPSFTFPTTASAFARCGYQLVFAEIDPRTMMIDVDDAGRKIGPQTAAVVAVHYGGQCADIVGLRDLCKGRNVVMIEDAAQGFDAFLDGRALGTLGELGCFSFHETKNIHAGLGGALAINSPRWGDRARHIWERGTNRQALLRGSVDKYSWVEIGGSFYPSELQAAFLLAQLEAVEKNTEARRRLYAAYAERLAPLRDSGAIDFPDLPSNFRGNGHAFFVLMQTESARDYLREALVENGIDAVTSYVPLHSSSVGRRLGNRADDLPVTEAASKRILRLPMHNNLHVDDIAKVCAAIEAVLAGNVS